MFFLLAALGRQTLQDDIDLYSNIELLHNIDLRQFSAPKTQKKLFARRPRENKPVIPNIQEEIKIRKPIRVYFDTEEVFSGKYPNTCRKVGQVIVSPLLNNANYTCTEVDIFTEEKQAALAQIFENLKSYLGKMIQVKHEEIELTGSKEPLFAYERPKNIKDVDHYIKVFISATGLNIIAGSAPVHSDPVTKRPWESAFAINARLIPTVAQDHDSIPRDYFNVMFHEVMHSLGMNINHLQFWINPNTGYLYNEEEAIRVTQDKFEKMTFHICTPNAKRIAQKYLKRTKTDDGYEYCMEFEDLGGPGTSYTHPKGSIYRQDIMVGTNPRDGIISPVVCSLIADMGYYNINWSMCKETTWLSDQLLTDEELQNMARKPVYKTFPKRYQYTPNTSFVSHDLRGYSDYVKLLPYDMELDKFQVKKYGDLYIPPNRFMSNTGTYDYAMLKNPKSQCQRNQWAMHYVNSSGLQAYCANSSLSKGVFYFLDLANQRQTCKNGEIVRVDNEIYICPDLDLMKKVIKFYGTDYFIYLDGVEPDNYDEPANITEPTKTPEPANTTVPTSNVVPTNTDESANNDKKPNKLEGKKLIYYVILPSVFGGLLLVTVIVVVTIYITKRRRKAMIIIEATSGLNSSLLA